MKTIYEIKQNTDVEQLRADWNSTGGEGFEISDEELILTDVEWKLRKMMCDRHMSDSTGHQGRNGFYSTYFCTDFDLKHCLRELWKVSQPGTRHFIEKFAREGKAYESDIKKIANAWARAEQIPVPSTIN